jgi:hypothetical protein
VVVSRFGCKIVSIEAEVFQLAYDFAGGGLYGTDRVIQTKEQADHSLLYLLAVALLDGDVQPAQFKPDRIIKAYDAQPTVVRLSVGGATWAAAERVIPSRHSPVMSNNRCAPIASRSIG